MSDLERQTLISNERLKLLATFVNGMGIAMFAVGALAPVVSSMSQTSGIKGAAAFTMVVCFIGALGLHYLASIILKGLR